MRHTISAAWILLLICLQPCTATADDWQVFTPDAGGFEIQLPPTRTRLQHRESMLIEGKSVSITLLIAESRDGDGFFAAGFQYPTGGRKISNDEFFNGFRRGFQLKDGDLRVSGGKRITTDGKAGMEFKMEDRDGHTGFFRIYRLANDRVAMLGIVGDALAAESPVTVKFFKSFKALAEDTKESSTGKPLPAFATKNIADPKTMDGLVAYWAFEEGSGAAAGDEGPAHAHATLTDHEWTTGVRGQGLRFNGRSGLGEIGTQEELNFPAKGAFTIGGWFRYNSAAEAKGPLISFRNSRDGGAVLDVLLGQGGRLTTQVRSDRRESDQPVELATKDALPAGQWHHFALTRGSDGVVQLFVNGARIGRSGGGISAGPITSDLRGLACERYWLLKKRAMGVPYFKGELDEFCIFSRALSGEEIAKLAGRGK